MARVKRFRVGRIERSALLLAPMHQFAMYWASPSTIRYPGAGASGQTRFIGIVTNRDLRFETNQINQ